LIKGSVDAYQKDEGQGEDQHKQCFWPDQQPDSLAGEKKELIQ
jgi:hypothetical protein